MRIIRRGRIWALWALTVVRPCGARALGVWVLVEGGQGWKPGMCWKYPWEPLDPKVWLQGFLSWDQISSSLFHWWWPSNIVGEVSFLEPFSFLGKDSPASCRAGGVSVLLYWCLRASLGRGMGVSQLSLRPYLLPGFQPMPRLSSAMPTPWPLSLYG